MRKWLVLTVLGLAGLGAAVWGAAGPYQEHRIAGWKKACLEARTAGDWKTVESVAGQWRSAAPDSALPIIFLAESARQREEYVQAAELLDKLPDDDPLTPTALLERVELQFGPLNDPAAGAQTCERIIAIAPETSEAHQKLVFYYAMTVQRAKTIRAARRAIASNCDMPETYVYLLGADWLTFANGYTFNQRWLERDPQNEQYLVARAVNFISSSGIKDKLAADRFTASLKGAFVEGEAVPRHEQVMAKYFEEFPKNVELLAYFLDKAYTHGDESRVAELLAQAPPAAADDNRFWRYKGWLHASRGENDKALAAYRKGLALHPFDFVSRHQLAGVLRRVGAMEEVEKQEALSREGAALRETLMQVEDVTSISAAIMKRIADYAERCGDRVVASQVRVRLNVLYGRSEPTLLLD